MFRQFISALLVATLAGCGTTSSGVATPRGMVTPRVAEAGTHVWHETVATGTGNVASIYLELSSPDSEESQGPAGHMHVMYADRSGYFKNRTNLQAYVKVLTTKGDIEKRDLPMTMGSDKDPKDDQTHYFGGDFSLKLSKRDTVVKVIELAFSSSDRYGNLKWDSDNGNNYRISLPAGTR